MAALGWLQNLALGGTGAVSVSVAAPNIYAHWDVEILSVANFDSETSTKANFDIEQEIKPNFKADIDG